MMTRVNKQISGLNDYTLMQELIQSLYDKKSLSGPDGLFTKMLKMAYEASLEGEMEAHMLMEKLGETGNRRNGITRKTVKSDRGIFELETPRDRYGTFEPTIVRKRQTVLTEEIDAKILSLYRAGTSYSDISHLVTEIYGISVSDATISAVTDKLLETVSEWRSRPLDSVYPVIFMDGMYFKVRQDGRVQTKVMYNLLGINTEGKRDILGMYFCDSEGASDWLGIMNDLKARGVKDVLIACVDGLKGFPEAIATAFPQCETQLCIVHQIRNSLKMVTTKDRKEFMADLKTVYKAPNKEVAESNLKAITEKWPRYHMALRPWHNNWHYLSAFFKFSPDIRRLVYTTNTIEGFHRQIRKYTKTKGALTSENALLKITFCAITNIMRKWTHAIPNWATALSELDLHFPNRLGSQF